MNRKDWREGRGLEAYRAQLRRQTSPTRQIAGAVLSLLLLAGIGFIGLSVVRGWRTTAPSSAATSDGGGDVGLGDIQGIAGRLFVSLQSGEIDQPAGSDPTPVKFDVRPGETAAQVADRLQQADLIRDATVFRTLMRAQGVDKKLEAGTYELRRTMTMREIAAALQKGRPPAITVTIPEGWRSEEIGTLLAGQGLVDSTEFGRLVQSGEGFSQSFLASRPSDTKPSLEGYLFPDTYTFDTTGSDARRVLNRMLNNFGAHLNADLQQAAATQQGTLYQALVLASIVEREARVPDERPLIAGVYMNRLRQGMKLDADPTVQYAMGFDKSRQTWWRPLTVEDYQFASPWNTYLHPGLPPGPICNSGLASLRAAISPTPTDYLYFVARKDGSHLFAKSFEEHVRNVNGVK